MKTSLLIIFAVACAYTLPLTAAAQTADRVQRRSSSQA